jgi:hypothetical protein
MRASAAGMTASASNSVARTSVIRFIESSHCNFIGIVGKKGQPTAASIVGLTNDTSEMAGMPAPADGIMFHLLLRLDSL